MALASPVLLLICFYTHSLRCGLEECRQLRWLCPKSCSQSTRRYRYFRKARQNNFGKARHNKMKKAVLGLVLTMLVMVFAGCRHQMHNSPNQTSATESNPGPKGDRPEVMDRLRDSAKVLEELINVPENNIPETV